MPQRWKLSKIFVAVRKDNLSMQSSTDQFQELAPCSIFMKFAIKSGCSCH